MSRTMGKIVIMGSGELTATMVEVHKLMLRPYGNTAKAIFIDTPAGFQLNVDALSRKAMDYFTTRVGHPLEIASFKSSHNTSEWELRKAISAVETADYILVGPGSPTYALRQWQASPLPGLISERIRSGACLVASSAAALTIGSFTLPVYEIYKVGDDPHWVAGLKLLNDFGMDLIVIPHWNNTEGGNHDTRYCFMGARRLGQLEALLTRPVDILGIDEHTALIIDFEQQTTQLKGIGSVTLRRNGRHMVFAKGDALPLALLMGANADTISLKADAKPDTKPDPADPGGDILWTTLHQLADGVRAEIEQEQWEAAAKALLALEGRIWGARQALEEAGGMGAARELFREILIIWGTRLSATPGGRAALTPLVEGILELRAEFRERKQWAAADAVRDCLLRANVVVADTDQGARWELIKE
jgi:peptidase E